MFELRLEFVLNLKIFNVVQFDGFLVERWVNVTVVIVFIEVVIRTQRTRKIIIYDRTRRCAIVDGCHETIDSEIAQTRDTRLMCSTVTYLEFPLIIFPNYRFLDETNEKAFTIAPIAVTKIYAQYTNVTF